MKKKQLKSFLQVIFALISAIIFISVLVSVISFINNIPDTMEYISEINDRELMELNTKTTWFVLCFILLLPLWCGFLYISFSFLKYSIRCGDKK